MKPTNHPKTCPPSKTGYPPQVCGWCKETFTPRRYDQVFCTGACGDANKNHEAARGKMLYRMVYHWQASGGRMGKAPNGAGLGDISRMVREMIAQDKREGRLPPPLPFTNR